MKAENEIINEVLELYEFHKTESEKFGKVLGILRGTPDNNKIIIPTQLPKSKKQHRFVAEVRKCKHPKCKKEFVPMHKGQLYCSNLFGTRGPVMINYYKKKEMRKAASIKQFTDHTDPQPPLPADENYVEQMKPVSTKDHKSILQKIKKEIPIKEVERPTTYHEG